ncbi:MAG TPA: IclR family transcriptional regulator [Microscillaceae bacterium]|nr:IclR family transcriptional regulator [Microscillaceae bacterium]
MANEIKKTDFIQSLEKGLNVITAFDHEHAAMTLTQVAKKLDLTRANARRILLTLEHLGFVSSVDGKLFSLTPKVLCLGYSYMSSLSYRELAQPYMEALAAEVNESCSMSVLDDREIVYVARVQTKRIMTIALGVGTRLPVQAASMGKVLLAGLEQEALQNLIKALNFEAFTSHTLIDPKAFIAHIQEVRQQGWALSDQELEIGVRSVACPLKDKDGKTLAALNISGHASRVTKEEMLDKFLPALQNTVAKIEQALKNKV